jgi:hypothetical protein
MQFDASHRTIYLKGAWDGAQAITKMGGMEIRTRDSVTFQQAAERVYRRLLYDREIRQGPFIEILFSTLDLVLTDRQGNALSDSPPTAAPANPGKRY